MGVVGVVGRGRAADFVAFDCTSQEGAAQGHVVHGCRRRQNRLQKNGHPLVPEMSVEW